MNRLVLRGHEILERSGELNPHRLSLKVKVSYPTIEKYINRPEKIQAYDTVVLAALFLDGLGLTAEEISAMPLSAFFEVRGD